MNIFYLHNDPETCAIEHVDKHVVKMILEYAQLLSTAWCRQSADNYKWLYDLWRELMKEYTFRYGKHHECEKLISVLVNVPKNIGDGGFTEPTPAMPDDYIVENDSIASYHKYYKQDKKRMFSWKNREVPAWI
jgi:hypothetical protein